MHPLLKQCYEAVAGARSLASPFKTGEIGALTHSVDLSILIPLFNQIKRRFNRLEFKFLRCNNRERGALECSRSGEKSVYVSKICTPLRSAGSSSLETVSSLFDRFCPNPVNAPSIGFGFQQIVRRIRR
jgi:hypothetical protein